MREGACGAAVRTCRVLASALSADCGFGSGGVGVGVGGLRYMSSHVAFLTSFLDSC